MSERVVPCLADYCRRVAAYQLDLFGAKPRAGRFRPNLWFLSWAGCAWPLSDDEVRQLDLLIREFVP